MPMIPANIVALLFFVEELGWELSLFLVSFFFKLAPIIFGPVNELLTGVVFNLPSEGSVPLGGSESMSELLLSLVIVESLL